MVVATLANPVGLWGGHGAILHTAPIRIVPSGPTVLVGASGIVGPNGAKGPSGIVTGHGAIGPDGQHNAQHHENVIVAAPTVALSYGLGGGYGHGWNGGYGHSWTGGLGHGLLGVKSYNFIGSHGLGLVPTHGYGYGSHW